MACVLFSTENCQKCDVLKHYLQVHGITHTIRMLEDPETKVEALMLNIFSTPALAFDKDVLHATVLFPEGRLDEATLLAFLRRHSVGKA